MATSIAAQLQTIRSVVQTDSESRKRPITRPSILFDPKEAADIDVDTILDIALSGLEALISIDERFRNYKSDLFSPKSKDLDRELMREDENNRINATIGSYLRLLSGHLQLPFSLKTLEYLIRRYKVHVYNTEDLILCALPYHDTHAFVRIVQLLDTRNNRWKFLEGVKKSGAPPPRNLLVQQCIRDMGVLDALCNYAIPSKKIHPSRPVVSFCTAVVIEILDSLSAISDDVVKRILPFVVSGLQAGCKRNSDHKAGSLMIIGLLASKAALSTKLIHSLMRSIAQIAQEDAKIFSDLHWFRLSTMALINLAQLQSLDVLPKKVFEILVDTRDVPGILLELYKDFNIDKFLSLLLESLIDHSLSGDACHQLLFDIIETIPFEKQVNHLVSKVLSSRMRTSQRNIDSTSLELGSSLKKILMLLKKKYPSELRYAVKKSLESTKIQANRDESEIEILYAVLDGNIDSSVAGLDSKVWFSLHHPKAEIRRSTLVNLSKLDISDIWNNNPEGLITIQEALLRQLCDNDLTVVQAALSIEGLPDVINPSYLFEGIADALKKSLSVLRSSSSDKTTVATDVAAAILRIGISKFHDDIDYLEKLAAVIFPLLLILPKTLRLNYIVLELAKEVNWPLYCTLGNISIEEVKLEGESVSSINMKIVSSLAEAFLMHHTKYMSWLINCCKHCNLSKTLLFLVMMQSIPRVKTDHEQFSAFFEACFSYMKTEWEASEASFDVQVKEYNKELLQWDVKQFLLQLFNNSNEAVNASTIICLFWKLMEALREVQASDVSGVEFEQWVNSKLQGFFVFFTTSKMKHVFKEHLHSLVTNCKMSSVDFLAAFFLNEDFPVAVQVESLHCLTFNCSEYDERPFQMLKIFPALLVPLSSDNQDIRTAAMGCIEELCSLLHRDNFLSKKNGSSATWIQFLDGLLGIIIQQKRLILSDEKLFPSILTSLLGSSNNGLQVPQHVEQRLDESTKESVLAVILDYVIHLPASAKLRIISMLKGLGHRLMRVKDVEGLLSQLMDKCSRYYFEGRKSSCKLSETEVKMLCLLLEICALSASSLKEHGYENYLMRALQLDRLNSEESAAIGPCITVLHSLTDEVYSGLTSEKQVLLFQELVFLSQNANGDLHNATRETLLRLNITCSTVVQTLDLIYKEDIHPSNPASLKKKKKLKGHETTNFHSNLFENRETMLSFLSSLLDILVVKKGMPSRESLTGPLFKLLAKFSSDDWLLNQNERSKSSDTSQTTSSTVCFLQQTLMLVIEDIIASLLNTVPEVDVADQIDVKLLIGLANSTRDSVTRNHVLSLLTSTARTFPEKILDYILDILAIIGKSTVTQTDGHSQRVFEDLLSALVPCWLAKSENMDKLLQIFMDVVPKVAEHRRLSIFLYLLRILGERESLASLLLLLFRSLVPRNRLSFIDDEDNLDSLGSSKQKEWEFVFALQICEQYSSTIWLPSLVLLLQMIGGGQSCPEKFMEMLIAMNFTSQKLQDPEFMFKLESDKDSDETQGILKKIMEHVVFFSQLIDKKGKKSIPVRLRKKLRESMHSVLRIITKIMRPSAYFSGITGLLVQSDGNVQKKALSLLCESIREQSSSNSKHKKSSSDPSRYLQLDVKSLESFEKMCVNIIRLVDTMDESDTSVKLSAISTLQVLARTFATHGSIFKSCLQSITRGITSSNLAIVSSCLQTSGAVIDVLGPAALAELPGVMENVIKKSHEVLACVNVKTKVNGDADNATTSSSIESLMLSILISLEAIIDKLGGFLSPYLEDILKLLILVPECILGSKLKLNQKADVVKKLLIEKIPARLVLPNLLKIYSDAVDFGDLSVVTVFEMLGSLVGKLDRSSVGGYHGKIFDLCLLALDLRRQHPISIQNVAVVEESTVNALIALTMKLTETMFKPLFLRSVEWAESHVDGNDAEGVASIDRTISFYVLVNKLAVSHRSLFVPYFKHLLQNSVSHLSDVNDGNSVGLIRKKKKAKIHDSGSERKVDSGALSLKSWHLRALVVSALHKCFLYDTGNLKFLDSTNFQVLLKPIVSQLVTEPPAMLDEHPDIPSVKEVDDSLVVGIGQMAVTAGSDLLWKPLNHEVLLQTRSDKVRARVLGLRIVKHLLDNLKEEYLVFLPETIPFLGELLEDVEPTVKSLTQDILTEMEMMSGESLRQYLQ